MEVETVICKVSQVMKLRKMIDPDLHISTSAMTGGNEKSKEWKEIDKTSMCISGEKKWQE